MPKIHKLDTPYRLIISSINSPLHSVSEFLHRIIIKNVPKAKSHLFDSFELVKKLESVKMQPGYILVSLDVVSLFTNVPVDLASKSVKSR